MEDYGTEYQGDGGRTASLEPGVNAYITFENGVRGILTGWKRIPQDMVVHVVGTEARIELDVEGWRVIADAAQRQPRARRDAAEPVHRAGRRRSTAWPGMAAGDPRAARARWPAGRRPTSTGETARRTVAITDAILQSAAQGNVRVPVTPPPWARSSGR